MEYSVFGLAVDEIFVEFHLHLHMPVGAGLRENDFPVSQFNDHLLSAFRCRQRSAECAV